MLKAIAVLLASGARMARKPLAKRYSVTPSSSLTRSTALLSAMTCVTTQHSSAHASIEYRVFNMNYL
ncbi:hypothetical protein FQZ97_737320 [compost metagenome]